MLITEQPDKMLRDLRNTKGSTQLSAMSIQILFSGDNRNVLKLVVSHCMSQISVKVPDTARPLLHCSRFKHLLLRQQYLRLVISLLNAAFRQSVPSQILFSVTPRFVATY